MNSEADQDATPVEPSGWAYACPAGDVASTGQYATGWVGGVPVLVTRAPDDELRAFVNLCRHENAILAKGVGTARALLCPFHAWVYRLDGSLARSAQADATVASEPDPTSLLPLAVCVRDGSVLVHRDLAADPPLQEG